MTGRLLLGYSLLLLALFVALSAALVTIWHG